ncbi:MAG: ABC transporter ATP-binding protein [Armatimonadota bacterium]|nr:ABC transporter ATP-binding protein [Armatimonadota bacterium]MDR7548632.1 ABC transporter ATP-binding protein [Armatimonadota bacterium]
MINMGASVVMRGIVKRFGHVVANDHVDFDLALGEIHGLLGENGSGKTTLMSILYGLYQPDAGEIRVHGAPVALRGPRDALERGIAMIPQQFRLVPTLTVAENIALGLDPRGRPHRHLLRDVERRLMALSEQYGLQIAPTAAVGRLSMGERQRVEILRALYHDSRVLLMDEPTSVLTPREVDRLLQMLAAMTKNERRSVVLVTHKILEVLGVADRVTVLRQGRRVATLGPGDLSADALVAAMMGQREPPAQASWSAASPRSARNQGRPILEFRAVCVSPAGGSDLASRPLHDVTFTVRSGEIFGIAGVEGNGQRELEFAAAGLLTPTAGTIALDGNGDSQGHSGRAAVAYIPSDRPRWGVALDLTVAENLLLRHAAGGDPWALAPTRRPQPLADADNAIATFGIHPPRRRALVRHLSGGNGQKVVVARELYRLPAVVVAAQPTAGLDVATSTFVRGQLRRVASAGAAVLLISSDLDELQGLCDRIGVIYQGRLMGIWDAQTVTRAALGAAMAGLASAGGDGNHAGESPIRGH